MTLEKYCNKCGLEIVDDNDCATMYEGKKFCECKKIKGDMMEKKFIVRPQNKGKILGLKVKVHMSDEPLTENSIENININLSDVDGFKFEKDSRFEVILKQILLFG